MTVNPLLIAILIVFLIFMILGWWKGFLRLLFSLVAVALLTWLMGKLTASVSDMLSGIATGWIFLISFLVALVIVLVVYKVLGIANHIPIIRGVNRILGLVAGAVEAYVVLSFFFFFVSMIAGTALGETLTGWIADSAVLSLLYKHQLLTLLKLW